MATEKVKVYEEQGKKAGLPIWAWLLPLLLILLLGIWLLSRRHNPTETASAAPVSDQTKPDTGTPAPAQDWTAAGIAGTLRQNGRIGFGDSQVHFATASAALQGDSQAVLDQTAEALKQNADWKLQVVGHTDSVGSAPANDQLAQQRASSVMAYLVAHGVDANRLRVQAEGQNQPVASNATDAGRAENRRVELIKD